MRSKEERSDGVRPGWSTRSFARVRRGRGRHLWRREREREQSVDVICDPLWQTAAWCWAQQAQRTETIVVVENRDRKAKSTVR